MEYFYGNQTYKNLRILINHYKMKSREEFLRKNNDFKGDVAYGIKGYYSEKNFTHEKDNDVFDNSILKYRENRLKAGASVRQIDYEKLVNALMKTLSPMLKGNVPEEFFDGKLETFLTCLALSTYLKENVLGKERGEILEELSLKAIYFSMSMNIFSADAELLLNELPNILSLKYPEVKEILKDCPKIIEQLKNGYKSLITNRTYEFWRNFNDYDNLQRLLEVLNSYNLK